MRRVLARLVNVGCVAMVMVLGAGAQQPDKPGGPPSNQGRPSPGGRPQQPQSGRPVGKPQPQRPQQPQPGRPVGKPQPVRPGGGGGMKPRPQPQPSRPQPQKPQPQPGRPQPGGGHQGGGRPGGSRPGGQRPPSKRPPQWGRPPQQRPGYQFRPTDRDYLRRFYLSRINRINRARRPVFAAGGYFPYADISYLSALPPEQYGYLPPPPPGYQMGYYDGYVVVYDPLTYFIANVIDLLQ